jgi:hypothetical protein
MFARYFMEIGLPFGDAEKLLLRSPESWLPGAAKQADSEGQRLLAEVGFGSAVRVRKEVQVTLRQPIRTSGRTILAISWHATGNETLFPALDADVEIAPFGQ